MLQKGAEEVKTTRRRELNDEHIVAIKVPFFVTSQLGVRIFSLFVGPSIAMSDLKTKEDERGQNATMVSTDGQTEF